MTAVADLKRAHRAIWAAEDYAAVAQVIDELPPRDLLARLEITPGQAVLDVATGTGNIAIRAAAAGRAGRRPRPHSRARSPAPSPIQRSAGWVCTFAQSTCFSMPRSRSCAMAAAWSERRW